MRLAHPHALPVLQVSPAQHAIAAAAYQHRSGRTQARAFIIALGSFKVYRRSPLRTSQRKRSPLPLPPPPLASRVPSGLQPTLATLPRCPCDFVSIVPLEASQRHTLLSSTQLARRVPSGLQATLRVPVDCPWLILTLARPALKE